MALLSLVLVGWAGVGHGGELNQAEPVVVVEREDDWPSLELLDFLGGWETEDGQWVDPVEIDNWAPTEEENDDVR